MRKVRCFSPGNGGRNNCNGLPTTTMAWWPGSRLEQSNNYHLVHSLSSSSANNDSNNVTRHEFGVPLSLLRRWLIWSAEKQSCQGFDFSSPERRKKNTFSHLSDDCSSREAIKWRFVWCDCSVFLKTKCQILETGNQCANISFSGLIFCVATMCENWVLQVDVLNDLDWSEFL